jgi:ketosteroid isomerase-like protein
MSQENVDIVRRGIEAAFRRPKPDLATLSDVYHPDHEFVSLIDPLEGGNHRGARGFHDWLLKMDETVGSHSTVERVTEIDEDRVLAVTPFSPKGKSSGVSLPEQRVASIVTVRDGKIIRSEAYSSPEQALKAVGLAE